MSLVHAYIVGSVGKEFAKWSAYPPTAHPVFHVAGLIVFCADFAVLNHLPPPPPNLFSTVQACRLLPYRMCVGRQTSLANFKNKSGEAHCKSKT